MHFHQRIFNKIVVATVIWSMQSISYSAGTLTIPVTVLGTIAAAPLWQDGLSAPLPSMAFDFTGSANSVAATNVDSAVITAKIVNMSVLNTIVVTTPTTCKIGASAIVNTDIRLIVNITPVASGGTFTMTNAVTQPFKLRFVSTGNYGLLSGVVTCTVAGSLVYAY